MEGSDDVDWFRSSDAPTRKSEYGQYALVFASMHCSAITCSSCAETPWINPFSSLTGSAATGLKEVVDMAKGKEGKPELARRGQLYANDDDGGARSGELDHAATSGPRLMSEVKA